MVSLLECIRLTEPCCCPLEGLIEHLDLTLSNRISLGVLCKCHPSISPIQPQVYVPEHLYFRAENSNGYGIARLARCYDESTQRTGCYSPAECADMG